MSWSHNLASKFPPYFDMHTYIFSCCLYTAPTVHSCIASYRNHFFGHTQGTQNISDSHFKTFLLDFYNVCRRVPFFFKPKPYFSSFDDVKPNKTHHIFDSYTQICEAYLFHFLLVFRQQRTDSALSQTDCVWGALIVSGNKNDSFILYLCSNASITQRRFSVGMYHQLPNTCSNFLSIVRGGKKKALFPMFHHAPSHWVI